MSESERVNEWLKCGTDLAICRRERAIEFALRIIAAADERANSAAGVVDRNQRAFEIRHGRIPFAVFGRLIVRLYRMMKIRIAARFWSSCVSSACLRGVLHGRIERRVNVEAAVIDLVLCEDADSNRAAPRPSRSSPGSEGSRLGCEVDFRLLRLLRPAPARSFSSSTMRSSTVSRCDRRALRIFQRRKSIRAADQSGQQRRFGEIQFRGALAEISLRRGLNSVTTGAEINPVHVKLENLLLGELALDPQRDHRFEQFAAEGAAAERKTVARELLGDAARAFLGRAAHDIATKRAQNAAPIDPAVLDKSACPRAPAARRRKNGDTSLSETFSRFAPASRL